MSRLDIVGTDRDGYFVARAYVKDKEFAVFYNPHEDTAYLNEYIDFFTRFSVFYENDTRLHRGMKDKMKNCKVRGSKALKELFSEFR